MLVLRTFAPAFALVAASVLLAGCDGPSHPPPALPVTVTATDASGPLMKGQNAVFTFVVSNPSSSDVPQLQLRTDASTDGEGTSALSTTGITCVAQRATCPTFGSAGIAAPITLPAGGVLTFTVTTQVVEDDDGTVTQEMDAYSTQRSGDANAKGVATLADARDGYYELFSTSGLRDNLDIRFQAGATKFATAPAGVEHTFTARQSGYVFPSGLTFLTAQYLLAGQADFGHGAESFIGARFFAGGVADLDGSSFTLLGVATPAGGPATSTVRTLAIAGSTLTACVDTAPHTLATCPAASLRTYVLTQEPSGPIFTATDAADNDSFDFQVFVSNGHLLLLQADQAATGNVFAVGLSDATVTPTELFALGSVAGTHSTLDLKSASFSLSPIDVNAQVLSQGTTAALAPVAGGPAGLMTGTRPSDGATLLVQQQDGLVQISGPAGEFDVLIGAAAH